MSGERPTLFRIGNMYVYALRQVCLYRDDIFLSYNYILPLTHSLLTSILFLLDITPWTKHVDTYLFDNT